jgi:hypothetical protein
VCTLLTFLLFSALIPLLGGPLVQSGVQLRGIGRLKRYAIHEPHPVFCWYTSIYYHSCRWSMALYTVAIDPLENACICCRKNLSLMWPDVVQTCLCSLHNSVLSCDSSAWPFFNHLMLSGLLDAFCT